MTGKWTTVTTQAGMRPVRIALFVALGPGLIACANQKSETGATANSQAERFGEKNMPEETDYRKAPFATITGDTTSLEDFRGKVVLIVNVASECGYTPQYEGLQTLYEEYKDRGLVILGFPANNFGAQEPGDNEEILEFCTSKYHVTFPMMAKISVKGADQHPLYRALTTQSEPPGDVTWNFNKFLLDRDGAIVARFESGVEPLSDELTSAIEALL